MARKRGTAGRGRHARRSGAVALRRRPLLAATVAAALGYALLVAGPAAIAGNAGPDPEALRVIGETYAGDLQLQQLTGLAWSTATAELLVTGRGGPGTVPTVIAISPTGEAVPRGHLVRGLAARGRGGVPLDLLDDELVAAVGDRLVAARTGASRLDLGPLGIRRLGAVEQGPDGSLLLLDTAEPSVVQVPRNRRSDQITRIPLQTDAPLSDLAYNPSDDLLYAAESSTGRVSAFGPDGAMVATYEAPGVHDIGSIEFAPSADATDSPTEQSLFVTDGGGAPGGRVMELSTTAAPAVDAAAAVVQPVLVRTTDTSGYSPSSPDPSGVTYLPDRDQLLISDAEVEEMPIYAGANLWRTSLAGPAVGTGDTTDYTIEPAGVAYDPANQHLLVSDDDSNEVYDFAPGPDGLPGTGDDVVTSFDTGSGGNGDPEGVALDTSTGDVYTIDGSNREVYLYRGGSMVSHFDVGLHGLGDPEGIDYDSVRDTLVIVDQTSEKIYEVTKQGQLVTAIDISAASPRKAAGVTVAPASDGSGARNYYVVARGVDNNSRPDENDGKLYEFAMTPAPPPVGNIAPLADAGPDQRVDLGTTVRLDGSAADDGLPDPPATLVTTWSNDSGPGTVAFGDSGALSTTATFSVVGTYVLRLTVSDSEFERSDTVSVEVIGRGTPNSVAVPIAQGSDDAEERLSTGRMFLTGTDLELAVDGSNAQAVGLRFTDVGVPAGAVVTSAYVQFTVDEATTGDASLTVQGQAADNPGTFTTTSRDVSSRPRTTASVAWVPSPWAGAGTSGPGQRTPNLWPVVQEIVDRPGWAHGNALALVITGSGDRKAESFDGSADPVLHVEYTLGGPPQNRAPVADAGPNRTVTLPAVASLAGSMSDDGLPDPPAAVSASWAKLSGGGQVTFGDPAAPSTTAAFSAPGSYVLQLTVSDGDRSSTDTVSVEVHAEGAPQPQTLVVPVASGADDVEERLSSGRVSVSTGDLNLGTDAGRPQLAGMRFSGLSLPPGATIQRAYVQFRVDEVATAAANLSVTGQAVDDAPPFQAVARDLSSRPTTTTEVAWTAQPWPATKQSGPDQRTPDLSAVLQEIVGRPGWASGGSVVLLVRGDGERTAESFEGRFPPVLHIVYQPPAG